MLMGAANAQAQSTDDSATDDWGSTETSQPSQSTPGATKTSLFDSNEKLRGYADFEGFYGQFGASVGEIELDGSPNVDAGGGFTMTAGYRFLPWLAGEANLSYLGGGEAGNSNNDAEYFSVTVGPKIFPFGLLEDEQPLPEAFQPYALVAVGGGQYDISRSRFERSSFIARFILGFDVWITDNIGTFVEGGYHVAGEDDVDGTGIFTIGGQVRF